MRDGARLSDNGYFVQSTVFANVTDDMAIVREEIFGPVQQIIKFKTLEEVTTIFVSQKYIMKPILVIRLFLERMMQDTDWLQLFSQRP